MKNAQLLETLSNCLNIDTSSGGVQIFGDLQQGTVKSALIYADSNGKLIAAPEGAGGGGGLTEVSVSDLTATGTKDSTTFLRGDNTFAAITITSSMVTTALGYTPYNGSANPNGFITGITSTMISTALGYTPYNASNPNGYVSSLSSFTTSNLREGSNLYYTAARFISAFSVKTTTDLAEGTNLYWTNNRGDARYPQMSGSYVNPSWIVSLPFTKLTGTPSTLSGYGITDAYPLAGNPSNFLTSVPAQSFSSLTGKPTTLSGYGITDAYPLSGNPSAFLTGITSSQVSTALGYSPVNPNGTNLLFDLVLYWK